MGAGEGQEEVAFLSEAGGWQPPGCVVGVHLSQTLSLGVFWIPPAWESSVFFQKRRQ